MLREREGLATHDGTVMVSTLCVECLIMVHPYLKSPHQLCQLGQVNRASVSQSLKWTYPWIDPTGCRRAH